MSQVTSIPGRTLTLSSPCDLQGIRASAKSIRTFLEQQGLGTEELEGWELVIVEAGNNAVRYVHPDRRHLRIELSAEVTAVHVEIRVRDHTPGFELPDRFELPDPLSEGGRGLFLMSTLSDSLEYLRGRDSNCLTLRKRRRDPASPHADISRPESVEVAVLEATLQTMTEELAASFETLSAIFRFTEDLTRTGIDSAFIDRWLNELKSITGANWFVLRLAEPGHTGLTAVCTSPAGLALDPLPLLSDLGQVAGTAELAAALKRSDLWFDGRRPLAEHDPLHRFGPELAGVSHPLYVGSELVGVLTIGFYGASAPLTAGQVNTIQTLADFVAIQVRNAQFQQAQLHARLLERDYVVASRIHRSLLPREHPRIGRWNTHGSCESAHRVGGDFYDVIRIGDHGLFLAVADVMGKGLSAALFATVFRTLLRSRLDLAPSPAAFLNWLNAKLASDLAEVDMFITAQVVHVDLRNRELRVAGAGHPPLLLAARGQDPVQILSSGPPLGIAPDLAYEEDRLPLAADARFLLYTDGVTESTDAQGEQIGTAPLLEILAASLAAGEGTEGILERFRRLQASLPTPASLADDRTLVLLVEEPGPLPAAT